MATPTPVGLRRDASQLGTASPEGDDDADAESLMFFDAQGTLQRSRWPRSDSFSSNASANLGDLRSWRSLVFPGAGGGGGGGAGSVTSTSYNIRPLRQRSGSSSSSSSSSSSRFSARMARQNGVQEGDGDSYSDASFESAGDMSHDEAVRQSESLRYALQQRDLMRAKVMADMRLLEADPSKKALHVALQGELEATELELQQLRIAYVEALMLVDQYEGTDDFDFALGMDDMNFPLLTEATGVDGSLRGSVGRHSKHGGSADGPLAYKKRNAYAYMSPPQGDQLLKAIVDDSTVDSANVDDRALPKRNTHMPRSSFFKVS